MHAPDYHDINTSHYFLRACLLTGEHHIDLKVHGDGVMAQLIKSLIGGLSKEHDLSQQASNHGN